MKLYFWKTRPERRVNFEVSKSVFNFTQALMAARFKHLSRILLQKNSKSIMAICVANYCQKLALIFLQSPRCSHLFQWILQNYSQKLTLVIFHVLWQCAKCPTTNWQFAKKLQVYTSCASVCVRVGLSCSLLQRQDIFLLQVDKYVIPLQSKAPLSLSKTRLSNISVLLKL